MTAVDRTAYPRPGARLTREELDERYDLTETDLASIHATARGDEGRLMLAVLLKARQDLGMFPTPDELHAGTVAHLAARLGPRRPPRRGGRAGPSRCTATRPRCGPTCPRLLTTTRPSAWSPAPCSPRPRR